LLLWKSASTTDKPQNYRSVTVSTRAGYTSRTSAGLPAENTLSAQAVSGIYSGREQSLPGEIQLPV
jgi:hypothetical protein